MKNNKRNPDPASEPAIQLVLQAERDAEQAIKDCEQKARQFIFDARNKSQKIYARTDQRITNMELRHGHKLDRTIKAVEREGAVELRVDAGQQYDPDSLQAVVENLAFELCQLKSAAED